MLKKPYFILLFCCSIADVGQSFALDPSANVSVNIIDFGADNTGTVDSYASFSAAIAALPATGGIIKIPSGTWSLSSNPTWSDKSILWDINPGATFTGSGTGLGKFPAMNTNGGQLAVGPWIQSQSTTASPAGGGIAAFNIEMLQPASYDGQSVALYTGARGSNPSPTANVWSINPLIQADVGAGGTYQTIEVDTNNFSSSAYVKGISINGIGTYNPAVGLEIMRTGSSKWGMGIDVRNSVTGIKIENDGISQGIVIGSPTLATGTAIQSQQLADGADTILLQRNTDTASSGQLIHAVNAANNANLFILDTQGNLHNSGNISATGNITGNVLNGANLRLSSSAVAAPAGEIGLGTSTATSATTGSSGTPPAQVAGYLVFYIGKTPYKIPFYNQ